tara:strand:+ start:1085 stop:2146 length:1062 start_codon:yes stop_codon:yes gene_type:complete
MPLSSPIAGDDDVAFLSANADRQKQFHAAGLTPAGNIAFEMRIPQRGHGVATHPSGREAVIFARRPGNFAFVFDCKLGHKIRFLQSPTGSHFYGHGVYSKDGRHLFSTENNYGDGRGFIGVWDTQRGYQRMGRWASGGIGPHELVLSQDGKQLIVANGGLRTHPETGRQKLNIPTMQPSLTFLDIKNGTIAASYKFEQSRLRFLSIRHLAVNKSGDVCIAMQDQGPRHDLVPLVALFRRGSNRLQLLAAPEATTLRFKGYAGATKMDESGRFVAMSAPRGDRIAFWDAKDGKFLTETRLVDGCGVAGTGVEGEFVATSGTGKVIKIENLTGPTLKINSEQTSNRFWDNHLTRL